MNDPKVGKALKEALEELMNMPNDDFRKAMQEPDQFLHEHLLREEEPAQFFPPSFLSET
jgi:hypothetical protein